MLVTNITLKWPIRKPIIFPVSFINVLSISASRKCETFTLNSVFIRLRHDKSYTRYQPICNAERNRNAVEISTHLCASMIWAHDLKSDFAKDCKIHFNSVNFGFDLTKQLKTKDLLLKRTWSDRTPKKPNVNRNGLMLIYVRHKEMFQQYLFSLSNHQAHTLSNTVFKLFHNSCTTTTKLFCLYIVFLLSLPYRNLTVSFQPQFVSIAPSPRLVCSDNSSLRYTWYHAQGGRRKWRSCLSFGHCATC